MAARPAHITDRCRTRGLSALFCLRGHLVTVHNGHSRSIAELHENAARNPKVMGEGPVALFHRIVDAMVDHYRPEVEKLEDRLDVLEAEVFDRPNNDTIRKILAEKRRVAGLRRIVLPQRDVVSRLARHPWFSVTWLAASERSEGKRYADAAPWAAAMASDVETGRMPPWGALETDECTPRVPWKDDARLDDDERQALIDWAAQGAPEGDTAQPAALAHTTRRLPATGGTTPSSLSR